MTPVGDGEGAGDVVGVTDGNGAVGDSDGDGVGYGDSVGVAEGVVGSGDAVGTPKVGFGVGALESVGDTDGDGEGLGEPVGAADGSGAVGASDGDGEGFGEAVGSAVGLNSFVGATVGFVVGEGVPSEGISLGLGEGA